MKPFISTFGFGVISSLLVLTVSSYPRIVHRRWIPDRFTNDDFGNEGGSNYLSYFWPEYFNNGDKSQGDHSGLLFRAGSNDYTAPSTYDNYYQMDPVQQLQNVQTYSYAQMIQNHPSYAIIGRAMMQGTPQEVQTADDLSGRSMLFSSNGGLLGLFGGSSSGQSVQQQEVVSGFDTSPQLQQVLLMPQSVVTPAQMQNVFAAQESPLGTFIQRPTSSSHQQQSQAGMIQRIQQQQQIQRLGLGETGTKSHLLNTMPTSSQAATKPHKLMSKLKKQQELHGVAGPTHQIEAIAAQEHHLPVQAIQREHEGLAVAEKQEILREMTEGLHERAREHEEEREEKVLERVEGERAAEAEAEVAIENEKEILNEERQEERQEVRQEERQEARQEERQEVRQEERQEVRQEERQEVRQEERQDVEERQEEEILRNDEEALEGRSVYEKPTGTSQYPYAGYPGRPVPYLHQIQYPAMPAPITPTYAYQTGAVVSEPPPSTSPVATVPPPYPVYDIPTLPLPPMQYPIPYNPYRIPMLPPGYMQQQPKLTPSPIVPPVYPGMYPPTAYSPPPQSPPPMSPIPTSYPAILQPVDIPTAMLPGPQRSSRKTRKFFLRPIH